MADVHDRGMGHGNYIPALDKALNILKWSKDDKTKRNIATFVMFLSDGQPSDQATGVCQERINGRILRKVKQISSMYNENLTFGFFGFGKSAKINFDML